MLFYQIHTCPSFLDPLFAEHPAILPFLASGSKMQRMRQQKLSCILASVKVSLFLSCSLFFFLLCFHVSLTSLYAFECWAVGVGPTHVQWLPINPNTQCEIIKCVFTCCAWLGRRDTNTDRTATHCKYLSPSAGRARINNKQVAAKFFTETVAHVSVKCLVRRWLNIHMHTACYSSTFTEHCRNTHTHTESGPPLSRTLLSVISV